MAATAPPSSDATTSLDLASLLTSLKLTDDDRCKLRDGKEEEAACMICWSEPPKFGLSSNCKHFYCATCIHDYLTTSLAAGTSPVLCPGCAEGSAPTTPTASTTATTTPAGRIEGPTLELLEREGVVNKQLQFRLMRLQGEKGVDVLFQCPTKCGHFLVDRAPDLVVRSNNELAVRVGRCKCGRGVCSSCHQLVEDSGMETHICPTAQAPDLAHDRAALAFMKTVAKKCPQCNLFVEKTGGCDTMMCGTQAHGKLHDAIRNGGCGFSFSWSTGKAAATSFHNLANVQVTGNPATMYPTEIKELRRTLGITSTAV